MAYGDLGGAVTELVITCKAREGAIISKWDALALTGAYEVGLQRRAPIFGQALADAEGGDAFPVKVRGICIFGLSYKAPPVGKGVIILGSGKVTSPQSLTSPGKTSGTVLKVDEEKRQVHVLL